MEMKKNIIFILILQISSIYAQQTPPPRPAQEQPQVLTSGPVHEGYAEPVNLQIQEGLVVPIQPPANLNEIPPSDRPQGNYYWVPGYWAWDSDRNDYLWVSGCWRLAPPNTYWVPGYWTQVSDGWEWVAGFWAPIGTGEIEYLPPPPAITDTEPANPPTPDSIWVPQCWYWNQNQYVLRSGYWITAQPNWIWVPSHYTWTPRGYVFVAGHWDYPLENRGVLFSPVYFPRGVYAQTGYSYSPSIVVDIGALRVSLFTYPRYCHYFFGDYYNDSYIHVGIYPWFEFQRYHTWYDPIYNYDRWHYRRSEPHWAQRQRDDYDQRRHDVNLRPPRTYDQMEHRLNQMPEQQRRNFRMAEPLNSLASDKTSSLKFQKINTETHNNIITQTNQVHKFGEQRHNWEKPSQNVQATPPANQQKTNAPVEQPRQSAPSQHKQAVKTPTESHTQNQPTYAPPRDVHISRPERVRVSPPIENKTSAGEKGPPPQPDRDRQAEQRTAPEKNQGAQRPDEGQGRKGPEDSQGRRR
jgi:hypothetical protein